MYARRLAKRSLSRWCLRTWAQRAGRLALLRRFVRRIGGACMARALARWREHAATMRRLKALVRRMLHAHLAARPSRFFVPRLPHVLC